MSHTLFQASRPFPKFVVGASLVAAFAAPAARAAAVVDTAVAAPSPVGANSIDAVDWMAESFSLTAATTIGSVAVQTLDASPATDAGQSFSLAVYASVGGLPGLDFNAVDQGRLFVTSATYAADGWNGASGLQWQLTPGTYWLAVEAGGDPGAVGSLVLPAGAKPAPNGVAFYSGSSAYAATGAADAFGLRIASVAAVPEPDAWALTLAGLAVLVLGKRRGQRRAVSR